MFYWMCIIILVHWSCINGIWNTVLIIITTHLVYNCPVANSATICMKCYYNTPIKLFGKSDHGTIIIKSMWTLRISYVCLDICGACASGYYMKWRFGSGMRLVSYPADTRSLSTWLHETNCNVIPLAQYHILLCNAYLISYSVSLPLNCNMPCMPRLSVLCKHS